MDESISWLKNSWVVIKKHRNAYNLTLVASFGGMLYGWDTGLIGGILIMEPFQKSFGLKNKTPEEQKSFSNISGNIVSVLQAGCFLGALSSFFVSDYFGRRNGLYLGTIIFLLGSVIQTCSGINTTILTTLFIGRIIGGIGVGLISAIVPTYIGENVNKEIRGRCIGTMQLFNVTGIMISFFVNYGIVSSAVAGTSLQWRIPFALQIIPGVLLFFGLLIQNESPRWLVEKCRTDEALAALRHVRGKSANDTEIMKEFHEIIADFQGRQKLSLSQQITESCKNCSTFYQVSIGVALMFWQQWTGTNSINYYAPQIFSSIGLKGQTSALFATGIYGVIKVIMTLLTLMIATDQIGRKYCLMIGSAGQAFSMIYIGIHNAKEPAAADSELSGSGIFAIVCIYLFVVFYSIGWGLVPYVLAAECSPNHLRSFSMALALMIQWLINFVIARVVPIMLSSITYGTFLFFGGCSICCFLYALVCVPETAYVPLESIQKLFEADSILDILTGAFLDTFPQYRRSKNLVDTTQGGNSNVEETGQFLEQDSCSDE